MGPAPDTLKKVLSVGYQPVGIPRQSQVLADTPVAVDEVEKRPTNGQKSTSVAQKISLDLFFSFFF